MQRETNLNFLVPKFFQDIVDHLVKFHSQNNTILQPPKSVETITSLKKMIDIGGEVSILEQDDYEPNILFSLLILYIQQLPQKLFNDEITGLFFYYLFSYFIFFNHCDFIKTAKLCEQMKIHFSDNKNLNNLNTIQNCSGKMREIIRTIKIYERNLLGTFLSLIVNLSVEQNLPFIPLCATILTPLDIKNENKNEANIIIQTITFIISNFSSIFTDLKSNLKKRYTSSRIDQNRRMSILIKEVSSPQMQSPVRINSKVNDWRYCNKCKGFIQITEGIEVGNQKFHQECFNCEFCEEKLEFYIVTDNKYWCCNKDFSRLFLNRCNTCFEPILSKSILALGAFYHEECFSCKICQEPLKQVYREFEFVPVCDQCYVRYT